MAAFRAWLIALATDPDAATAAAMAYEALLPSGRDAWLDALDSETPSLPVPALAVYAPLIGVETDPDRARRIQAALAAARPAPVPLPAVRAHRGVHPSGEAVVALVVPVYLDFVELLVCRYRPDEGVTSVRRGPLASSRSPFLGAPAEVDGVELVPVPCAVVVEELAHAIVADRREGRAPAPELARYEFLFTPDLSETIGSS